MKLGFGVPVSGPWATPENQVRIAQRAEELGYESLWTFQRVITSATGEPWPPQYREVHDPTVTLAYLAGQTRRIRLGVAVLNAPYYSPGLLAKQAATLDVLSGGRLDLGLGIGWSDEEFAVTGAAFGRRGERLEEFLAAVGALWREDAAEFHGEFYDFPPVRMSPKPVQTPHPPVLLGASAPAALRRAGRLADGWISASGAQLPSIGEPIAMIRDAAREAGRDPDRLRFVCRGPLRLRPAGAGGGRDRRMMSGSLDEIASDLARLRAQGVTEVFFDLNFDPEIASGEADPTEAMHRADQVLEAFAPEPA